MRKSIQQLCETWPLKKENKMAECLALGLFCVKLKVISYVELIQWLWLRRRRRRLWHATHDWLQYIITVLQHNILSRYSLSIAGFNILLDTLYRSFSGWFYRSHDTTGHVWKKGEETFGWKECVEPKCRPKVIWKKVVDKYLWIVHLNKEDASVQNKS